MTFHPRAGSTERLALQALCGHVRPSARADARTLRTQGSGLVATINLTALGRSRSSSSEQIRPRAVVMAAVSAPSSVFRAPVFWELWKTSAEPVSPPHPPILS